MMFLWLGITGTMTSCDFWKSSNETPAVFEEQQKISSPEVIELINTANRMSSRNDLDSNLVDSALVILDKALKIDPSNHIALLHKYHLLMMIKSYESMHGTIDLLIEQHQDKPAFIFQKGLLYELQGDSVKAENVYKNGIKQFENLIDSQEDVHWQTELEFAQCLVLANQYERGRELFDDLRYYYPSESTLQHFEFPTKEKQLELLLADQL